MEGTRELVDAGQVGAALTALSLAGFVVAAALLFLHRRRGRAALLRSALVAAGVALLDPLWRVYNAIENAFGLDSVAALVLNLALFGAVGAAAGLVLKRLWPVDDATPPGVGEGG